MPSKKSHCEAFIFLNATKRYRKMRNFKIRYLFVAFALKIETTKIQMPQKGIGGSKSCFRKYRFLKNILFLNKKTTTIFLNATKRYRSFYCCSCFKNSCFISCFRPLQLIEYQLVTNFNATKRY